MLLSEGDGVPLGASELLKGNTDGMPVVDAVAKYLERNLEASSGDRVVVTVTVCSGVMGGRTVTVTVLVDGVGGTLTVAEGVVVGGGMLLDAGVVAPKMPPSTPMLSKMARALDSDWHARSLGVVG